MSIASVVENDTIKLPIHVPDGTRVEITFSENTNERPTLYERMKEFAGCIKNGPTDFTARDATRIGRSQIAFRSW
jgi:hypothetical protein